MKAGLAVSQSKEEGVLNIEVQVLSDFIEAVKAIVLPPSFNGFTRDNLMRTKNYYIAALRPDSGDLHTGATLWRKRQEI